MASAQTDNLPGLTLTLAVSPPPVNMSSIPQETIASGQRDIKMIGRSCP